MAFPTRMAFGAVTTLLLFFPTSGCVTETGPRPYTEEELVTYEHHCARWGEDSAHRACLEEQADRRADCYVVCADPYTFFPGCYDQCDDLYGNEECGRGGLVCLEGSEHVFTLARVPDAELGAACRAYFAHAAACGTALDRDPCVTFERTERREAVDTYTCLAARSCGDTTSCELPPDREEGIHVAIGTSVCSQIRSLGHTCPDELRLYLDEADVWLRQDVIDAVHECDVHDGAERLACLNAWIDAVLP